MTLRTLVVDDEPLARERLSALLREEPDVEVVGECADGASALRAIRRAAPDVILLDIQLPERDGFAVVEALGKEPHAEVIFVTAYDQFALRAFRVRALDYLLKPVDGACLHEALTRARERLSDTDNVHAGPLLDAVHALALRQQVSPTIAIKVDGEIVLLRIADIDWVESAGSHVCFHAGRSVHIVRQTMQQVERELHDHRFLRVHRCAIVNVNKVVKLKPQDYGEYAVELQEGSLHPVGRGYRNEVLLRLGRTRGEVS